MFYEMTGLGVPIYDNPVRADHAHTAKPSWLSPEVSPIIM